MNKIATLRYSFHPDSGIAKLFIQSDVFEKMFKELGFEVRNYTKEKFPENLFESLSAYYVRGVIDERLEVKGTALYTEKVANTHILLSGPSGHHINISHIRLTGITGGKEFRIKPIPEAKINWALRHYSEGIALYYKALQDYMKRIKNSKRLTEA